MGPKKLELLPQEGMLLLLYKRKSIRPKLHHFSTKHICEEEEFSLEIGLYRTFESHPS